MAAAKVVERLEPRYDITDDGIAAMGGTAQRIDADYAAVLSQFMTRDGSTNRSASEIRASLLAALRSHYEWINAVYDTDAPRRAQLANYYKHMHDKIAPRITLCKQLVGELEDLGFIERV